MTSRQFQMTEPFEFAADASRWSWTQPDGARPATGQSHRSGQACPVKA